MFSEHSLILERHLPTSKTHTSGTKPDLGKPARTFGQSKVLNAQARDSGKPEKIIDKIVLGKMDKFYEENCLLEQKFIKDADCTIQELVKQKIAVLGENIMVGNFSRFEIGK